MRLKLFRNGPKPHAVVKPITSSENGPNGYLIISKGQAAVIDIPSPAESIGKELERAGADLKYILITHAHPSHIYAVPSLKETYGGMFCMHDYDNDLLQEVMPGLQPDRMVKDKTILKLGDVVIKVLHTPGHTKGSLCFHVPAADTLFAGSTILKGGYGKIWGPKSMSLMVFSLKRLNYSIYDTTVIYPGRGQTTTMANEAWMNCLRSV